MKKAEEIAAKHGYTASTDPHVVLVIDEALEWAAQQCERRPFHICGDAADCHVSDARNIRAGKSVQP